MNPRDQLVLLRSIKLGSSLEALIARGFTYSQIASHIVFLKKSGLVQEDAKRGLILTVKGEHALGPSFDGKSIAKNLFIAPANNHRIKRLDGRQIYVPNSKRSSFFKEQGHQNSAT